VRYDRIDLIICRPFNKKKLRKSVLTELENVLHFYEKLSFAVAIRYVTFVWFAIWSANTTYEVW